MPQLLSKSLWRLYLFIFFVSFFVMGVGIYFLWNSILNEEKTRLIYSNKIIANSMESLLNKDEALFKLIGERLVEKGLFSNPEASLTLINEVLKENPELAGVGIADLQGQLRITSSNISRTNLPNLLENPVTSSSFKAALTSPYLVMGRTYFMKNLNEWVVPIRYKIVNSADEVVAVLATGLKLSDKYTPWQSESLQGSMRISIVNSDYYFQYSSSLKDFNKNDLYNKPISPDYLHTFQQYLDEQTQLSLDDFTSGKNQEIVPVIYPRPDGKKSIAAFSYNNKYKIFIFTINLVSLLHTKLLIPVSSMTGLLLLFNIVLFMLFKYLNTLQNRAKKNLEHQAQHDLLTGLPNIRFINNVPNRWRKKLNNSYYVVFIDLDDFKNSNDLHGHEIGDKLLCEVATQINLFFKNCLSIRQGGDEFIIIAPKAFSPNIKKSCQEFLESLKRTILIDSLEFSVRASIGIASAPQDGVEMKNIIRKADIAMYQAKRQKCGVSVFNRKLDIQNSRFSMISKELNSALERKEMYVVYQPQINNKTQKLIGFEALLRWDNKNLGQIPPSEFIPIAESTGAIMDIGNFVFQTALNQFDTVCRDALRDTYIDDTNKKLRLSLNVSIRQMTEQNFVENLFSLIDQFDCKSTKLMLEITETMTINRIDEIASILKKIQEVGIDISLDDFGTGYSSLSYISKLPINEIKIDKSFIQDIPDDIHNMTLIKSIINLGKSLNINVLAEGVETKQQLSILDKLGCQNYQGFYFSDSLSVQELVAFIKSYPDKYH